MMKVFALVMGVFMIFTIVLFARTKRVGKNNLFSSLMLAIVSIAATGFTYLHPTWWSLAVLSVLAIVLWTGKNSKQRELVESHKVSKKIRKGGVINLSSFVIGAMVITVSIFVLKEQWTWYTAIVWIPLSLIGLIAVLVVLHERLTNI